MRAVGGSLYIVGMLLFGWNIFKTWAARPTTYEVPVVQAPKLEALGPGPAGRRTPIPTFAGANGYVPGVLRRESRP